MMGNFPSVKKFYSFDLDNNGEAYELKEVNQNTINQFKKLIEKLETIPQVILCTRGDSKRSLDKHNDFFQQDLSKLFIVGEKSQSNIKKTTSDKYRHTHSQNNYTLIDELEVLINEVNEEVKNKPESHKVFGEINDNFLNKLREENDIDILAKWKVFFLSFLHNSGSLKDFKSNSPFLSMAYGYKKYAIAKQFAFSRISHDKAIAYLYALNAGDPYYMQTKLMTNELKQFGIEWYEDIHNEIMLINGMFPHFLLGILETTRNSTIRCIINPWLYDLLKNNKPFDYKNGLNINQENFNRLAENLGYTNFFFTDKEGNAFISDLDEAHIEKVIQP